MATNSGGGSFTWNGNRIYDDLSSRVTSAMEGAGERAVQLGRAKAHVVTGRMREEIYSRVGLNERGQMTLRVGSPVPETLYEVLRGGTHDWLRPTMDATVGEFRRELNNAARAKK